MADVAGKTSYSVDEILASIKSAIESNYNSLKKEQKSSAVIIDDSQLQSFENENINLQDVFALLKKEDLSQQNKFDKLEPANAQYFYLQDKLTNFAADIDNDSIAQNIESNSFEGEVILSVDEAMNKLTQQMGLGKDGSFDSALNLDNIFNNATKNVANPNINLDENNPSFIYNSQDCVTNDTAIADNNSAQYSKNTEAMILNAAMEEVNVRLRGVIANWVQENLPHLVKKILQEEVTRALKNFKF